MRADANERFAANYFSAWSGDHLHLILMPTEKCNFRCVYCYEDFSIGRMARPVIDGIKALVDRRARSLSSLEIGWFGGEPTVARDIVLEVMTHAQEVCRAQGVALRGGMTTNGFLLTGEAYRAYWQAGVTDYQITLDGPQETHDTTRLQANGKGSFAAIWNNLLEIKEAKLDGEILVRVHLTKQNIDFIPAFAAEIEHVFGDDARFRFSLQRIEDLGGPNDISDLLIPAAPSSWGHRAGMPAEIEPRGAGPETVMEREHPDDYVCYAAKANSYVVRADGRIGKCTVALKSDSNCIGRICQDGTLAIDEAKLRPWLSGWKTQERAALSCPAASVFT
jgi:uncharacterized protein